MVVNEIRSQFLSANKVGQKLNKKDSANKLYKSLSDTIETKNANAVAESDNVKVSIADSSWDEAFLQFYNFVEDRVKNGAPKYQIGGAELSIDEWKNLLKKIDGSLDAVKDQLAERNEEMEKLQDDNKSDESSEKLILELLRDRIDNDNTKQ